MTRTPIEIQGAMRRAMAAGDDGAVSHFRNMLSQAYKAETRDSATEGMSTGEKFKAGIGSGLVDVARKAGNIVGAVSDEDIAEQARIDESLLNTGAGLAGNILGGAAATAPVGMGAAGLVGKALGGSARAAGLGGRVAQAVGQGASEGALLASPGDRLGGAALGGAFAGGLTGAGGAVGNLVRRVGKPIVETTEEAKKLTKLMQEHLDEIGDQTALIPLSQAAKPGTVKQLYEGIVANIPGNPLRRQLERATDRFRATAISKALPEGVSPAVVFEAGDDLQGGFSHLIRVWDEAWKPVNRANVVIPEDFIPDGLKAIAKKKFGYIFPKQGQPLKGEDLTKMSQALQEMADAQGTGQLGARMRNRLVKFKGKTEELLGSQLEEGVKDSWKANKANYANFQTLLNVGKSATGGTSEFTPKALGRAAAMRAGKQGISGKGGELQELGVLGQKALASFPSRQGVFQTLAAMGATGAVAGELVGDNPALGAVAAVVLPFLGARGLASKRVQRGLMEGFSAARKAGLTMDDYAKLLKGLGFTGRQIAVATAVKE